MIFAKFVSLRKVKFLNEMENYANLVLKIQSGIKLMNLLYVSRKYVSERFLAPLKCGFTEV